MIWCLGVSDLITASPLTWPAGWGRTPQNDQVRARFHKKVAGSWRTNAITVAVAADLVLHQLKLMDVWQDKVIISTNLRLRLDGLPYSNQRRVGDEGVAVWWLPDYLDQHRVIAVDRYDRLADNLYAIGRTLEAMRGIDRWGGGEILERTFTGFAALPPPDKAGGIDPHQIIGIESDAKAHEKMRAYRSALSTAHPDHGGSNDQFHAVREAGKTLGLV